MRRTRNLVPAVCFAALAGSGFAQVLSPPEIQDPNMRALQEKHLTELKTVGAAISAHRFPYRLYFSRALDLNEQQQQRRDQRAIRFEKFCNQIVLQITANYYASYSAELMQKEERALRTMQEQDISQLPIFEDTTMVGAIYEDQILNLALQGKDLRKLVIREVMSKPLPQVSHDSPVQRVTHLLSHEGPAVFVVMGEGRYEILTKYDLMGTIAELMDQKR